ncbi:MAG TPA: pre-peptidase C-terminal domain-containing protein [Acidobacteriota bacterium]|nr:pre-peptidase C-terminal domain-containing protein [Acidobacteriota bacterium]
MKVNIKLLTATAAALVLAFALPAFAGGPLNLNPNDPDNVERWPNGGADIPYNPDQGGFATLSNAQFVQLVVDSTQAWADVPSASNTYQNNGLMPVDIDATNFCSPPPFNPGPISFPGCHLIDNLFFGTNVSDGFSPIVADEDGSIFATLGFGPGVLGFASPDTRDANGTPIEAIMFLNGGSVSGIGFPLAEFFGVTVHEFGHYSGLAHTVVNGQNIQFGDHSGPTPNNTFGNSPVNVQETMYPFALVGGMQETPHQDDIGILSFLYPEPGFLAGTAEISGTILAPNGTTPLTGVNVIARNLADPFVDAASSISGDRGTTGVYTINGLTPGADYAIFVDQILAGGFSTPPLAPLPGPEEFYNGASESNDPLIDDPALFDPVTPLAGSNGGIDVIFNQPGPGIPLLVGDDGFVELFLPFSYEICGQQFDSVFVNANGNLTFGTGDSDFTESAAEHLAEAPRIAGLWDDLSPFNLITGAPQGTVTFDQSNNSFSVRWEDVPEFLNTGSNTFEITLKRSSNHIDIKYEGITATDGLAGVSCGGAITSGFELAEDLSALGPSRINLHNSPARYQVFGVEVNDLANSTVRFNGTTDYNDNWAEPNNTLATARQIKIPFDSIPITRFTEIEPAGGDVDYYRFEASAGTTLVAEVISGQLDSLLGIFDSAGNLLDVDDDGGVGLLSRLVFPIPADGEFTLAVTTFADFDFDGDGNSGGRYVLNLFVIDGIVLDLGDDDFEEVALDFSFPFQGGNFNSVFVNSNGSLSFGAGDIDFSESVTEFLGGPPRIAPLWDDLSPNNGGLVLFEGDANSASVTFQNVPEFFSTGANNFTVTLDSSGDITIDYGSVTAVDGIVGVTPGGNIPGGPGAVDLSAAGGLSASGSTYEQFTFGNPFDLAMMSIIFPF